jgi:hypothetical protein
MPLEGTTILESSALRFNRVSVPQRLSYNEKEIIKWRRKEKD